MRELAKYAIDLHRKNSEQLGFIPCSRIAQYEEAAQIIPEYENGELCGYLIWGIGWPWFRIYQACVAHELRWLSHGRSLVRRAIEIAAGNHCKGITLRCRETNAAVGFWNALGFELLWRLPGGVRREANICVFVYWINDLVANTDLQQLETPNG